MNERVYSEMVLVEFLMFWTGLDADRLTRLYRAGAPWPIGAGCTNIEAEAAAAGVSVRDYLQALGPLIRQSVDQRRAQAEAGTLPAGDPFPELAHGPRVAEVSGEPLEVVMRVAQGVNAFYGTVCHLLDGFLAQQGGRRGFL